MGTKCGRWNPTAEQVKVLTDLFRSGLRTPTTDQIQKISSQLSFYGNIESKNVFYWFQNHKARERQKRRRKILVDEPIIDEDRIQFNNISSNKRKYSTKYITLSPLISIFLVHHHLYYVYVQIFKRKILIKRWMRQQKEH